MKTPATLPSLALAAALLLPASAPLAAGEAAGAEPEVRVRKVVIDCDGEDCPHEHHRIHAGASHHGGKHFSHGWMGEQHGAGGGFLGIGLTDLTPELRRHFGVPEEAGVLVSRIVEESPAARAGLQVGDIIAAVDGEPATSGWDLARAIRDRDEGESILLEIWREGAIENLTATLAERTAAGSGKRVEVLRCEDGQGDCPHHAEFERLCEGSAECRVEVECGGEECTCTVNGQAVECGNLPSPGSD